MTKDLAFWMMYVFAVLAGGYFYWPTSNDRKAFGPLACYVILLSTIALVGWKVFGEPVK